VHGDKAVGPIRKVLVRDGHFGPKEVGVAPEFLCWLTDPAQNGGGALIDFGCYGLNLMTWLMHGAGPLTVTAVTQQLKRDSTYARVDDEATLILTYPDAQAIIQGSWNWPDHRKDLEIFGTHGYVFTPDGKSVRMRLRGQQTDRAFTPKELRRRSPHRASRSWLIDRTTSDKCPSAVLGSAFARPGRRNDVRAPLKVSPLMLN